MSLSIASINSGSNANCYYIGNEHEAVLIDCGLACRKVERRLSRLNIPISRIKGIFVTHEHADHISGIPVLSKKHNIPVYITPTTLVESRMKLREDLVKEFRRYRPVSIGGLTITAFPKRHDASNPHSFLVTNGTVNVGIFTDIGSPCRHVKLHFQKCHAAFLESNYDEGMLIQGRYPWPLKRRVAGDEGHLSNDQALRLFLDFRSPHLSHLILSHLSKENNHPELVENLFKKVARNTQISVASRYEESPLIQITASSSSLSKPKPVVEVKQLLLFD